MTPPGAPALGVAAPDFTLPSTGGADVTLSALRGRRVLLAFFPLAFTSTCTAELCSFTENYARFAEAGAAVLPISVDSIPTLKAFKAAEHLGLDLLSDFKRDVSRQYGTLNDARFFSNRAYFLLDRDGILRWAHTEETNSNRRPDDELLVEIRRIG